MIDLHNIDLTILSKRVVNYYEALIRIVHAVPIRVDQGCKLTFDNVAIEAGRGKGAIKGSDPEIIELKKYIKLIQENQSNKTISMTNVIEPKAPSRGGDLLQKFNLLKADYEILLQENASLIYQNIELQKELKDLKTSPKLIRIVD